MGPLIKNILLALYEEKIKQMSKLEQHGLSRVQHLRKVKDAKLR